MRVRTTMPILVLNCEFPTFSNHKISITLLIFQNVMDRVVLNPTVKLAIFLQTHAYYPLKSSASKSKKLELNKTNGCKISKNRRGGFLSLQLISTPSVHHKICIHLNISHLQAIRENKVCFELLKTFRVTPENLVAFRELIPPKSED